MKRMFKTSLLLMALSLGIVLFSGIKADASKADDAKKAYQSKINASNKYKIIDIDKNGIPELITLLNSEHTVYSYNKKIKKVKKLASELYGSGPWVSKKKHMVVLMGHSSGHSRYTFYKVKGTKVKKVHEYLYLKEYNKNSWTYKIDGKKVSKKKIDSKLKKALKPYKNLRLTY